MFEHIKSTLIEYKKFDDIPDKENAHDTCGICIDEFVTPNETPDETPKNDDLFIMETPQCGHHFHK